MARLAWVLCVLAGIAAAQAPAATDHAATDSTALEKNVAQKTQEWSMLADALEAQLIKLLPCDPKAAAAIEQVSKASDARLAAIAAYLDDANQRAAAQFETSKKLLTSAIAADAELTSEKEDLAAERAGVNGQIVNLTESAKGKPAFAPAQDQLTQVSLEEQKRSDALDSAASHQAPSVAALRELVEHLEKRQSAQADVQKAFEKERAAWGAYYAARSGRAQMECSITQGAAAPRTQGKQGKQK